MRPLPILFACLALAACAADTAAPSLAPRPVEREPVGLPQAAAEPADTLTPGLPARLEPLVAAATEGHAAFEKERQGAEKAIAQAQGKSRGAEEWTLAQQALSALDAARGAVRDAAAAVEEIRQQPANATPANRAAVDAAAERIEALEEQEAATVAALAARLP